MPRPENEKIVHMPPVFSEFKPTGVALRFLDKINLSIDEYEALRLADYLGFSHEESALEMETSRPTFTRLIERARKKLTDFLINGRLLTIEGGNIHFRNNIIKCINCGHTFNISIEEYIRNCPQCASNNLINVAGGFGHGRCCSKSQFRIDPDSGIQE